MMDHLVAILGTVVGWVTIAVFAALGALLLTAGAAGMLQMVLLLWRGRQTTATVVADTSRHKNPKFRFTDDYGQTHVVSEAVQSWHRRYHADQQVTLVYLPERPEAFVVDRFADKWGILSFFFILGLIILFPCVLFMFGPARFISVLGRVDILAPLVFLIFGAVMLTLGLALLRKTLRFRQRAAKAVGIIIESKMWASGHKPGERETWDITVEFKDATGRNRQGDLRASDYRESRRYDIGAQVPILYDREHPSIIRFDSFMGVWFGNLVLLTLGAVFLVVGLLLWTVGLPFD